MPRSVPGLIADTFRLYRRYPLPFLMLAAGVVVPYQLIALATTGTGQFNRADAGGLETFGLTAIDWVLVTPLISALHVHAVAEIRSNDNLHILAVVRKGLRVLPVVTAAAIMAGLVIGPGLVVVVPGVYFLVRWHVVAQSAAMEPEGWVTALRRSWNLTKGNVLRVLGFTIAVGLMVVPLSLLVRRPFSHEGTTVTAVLVGIVLETVLLSFSALADALLYYDLRVRYEALTGGAQQSSDELPAESG